MAIVDSIDTDSVTHLEDEGTDLPSHSNQLPGAAVVALREDSDAKDRGVAQGRLARRIIAVGGGKGGIGKSFISANLAVHLAHLGRSVVLVDADLGGANLHTCLGIPPPERTLSDFVDRRFEDLVDVISETKMKGLGLISGALDFLDAANPKYTQKQRLLREIGRLDVDAVIIDLGGGTGFNILDFFLIADHGILTVVPEPTSIENAYRFIKAAYYRRLKSIELSWNLKPLVERAMSDPGAKGLRTPKDLIAYVERRDSMAGGVLRRELARFPLELVVNQTRTAQEEKLGPSIAAACQRYFGVSLRFLTSIPYDDAVWQAVRSRKPLVLENPHAQASDAIYRIAAQLGLES